MSATLTYSSVSNWIDLALWMERNKPAERDTETLQQFVRDIVQHTHDTGFYLRTGERSYMMGDLLASVLGVASHDEAVTRAFAFDWLPSNSDNKPAWYYVRWRNSPKDAWVYVRVGDEITTWGGQLRRLDWNEDWSAGAHMPGALYRAPSTHKASNVKELIAARHPDAKVQVTGQPPEE